MADSLGRDTLDAQAITVAFAGNASSTARALRVPCKVVIKAVQFVAAEREWLLSLWAADAICRSQCERLAELLDLIPPELGLTPQAADVRKAAQTLPGPEHLQCDGHASAVCTSRKASSGPSIAQVVIDLLPDGRVHMKSTRLGLFDASYAPFPDGKLAQEVDKLLAELRQVLAGVTPP